MSGLYGSADVKISGVGESPVPVKITIGPKVLFMGVSALVVWLTVAAIKKRGK